MPCNTMNLPVAGLISLALLPGCLSVGAPQDTDTATRTTHSLRHEPHRAAVCIARNVDRHSSGYLARIRRGLEPILIEVDVRAPERMALAELRIKADGSTAEIWMRDAPGRDELRAAMIEGC